MSDFDTFLVGSMGMEYSPLPNDQQEPRPNFIWAMLFPDDKRWPELVKWDVNQV